MSISGRADEHGTEDYKAEFPGKSKAQFYRNFNNLWVSSIGLGTYMGDATDDVDNRYQKSIRTALVNGINLIDTAANYRFQRSERLIGEVLDGLVSETDRSRDQIVISTKGGFVPYDGERPEDPLDYIQSSYIEPGVATEDDFTNNGHCMTPDYIEYQIHNSLNNLNLDTIDLFYVHNPEMQLSHRSPADVYDQLENVFELLEKLVDQGKIASYGLASWNGLRVVPEKNNYLTLETIHQRARRAGGEDHHLDAVQIPFNLGMTQASTRANQPIDEQPLTVLEACRRLDLSVFSAASIMQGKIKGKMPDDIRDHFERFTDDVLRSLQFNRSAPGVTSALVGMSSPDHVKQNLELGRRKPLDEQQFRDRFLEVVEDSSEE